MADVITCPSGLQGRVRAMKVREERVLADRKLAKSGGQVDELLAACWEETLDPGPYALAEGAKLDLGVTVEEWARACRSTGPRAACLTMRLRATTVSSGREAGRRPSGAVGRCATARRSGTRRGSCHWPRTKRRASRGGPLRKIPWLPALLRLPGIEAADRAKVDAVHEHRERRPVERDAARSGRHARTISCSDGTPPRGARQPVPSPNQIASEPPESLASLFVVREDAAECAPERRSVVRVSKVGDLVGDDVVDEGARRLNDAPV